MISTFKTMFSDVDHCHNFLGSASVLSKFCRKTFVPHFCINFRTQKTCQRHLQHCFKKDSTCLSVFRTFHKRKDKKGVSFRKTPMTSSIYTTGIYIELYTCRYKRFFCFMLLHPKKNEFCIYMYFMKIKK